MPKQRRTSRSSKGKGQKNIESGVQQARNQGVTWGGDPSVEIKRKTSHTKKTGQILTPTEDRRHITKIRLGTFHPENHFSKVALAKIPVDD